jgi:hypothetical protein
MNKVDEAAAKEYAARFGENSWGQEISFEAHVIGQGPAFDRGFMAAVELLKDYDPDSESIGASLWLESQWSKKEETK